ncbi:MAG: 5'/3'-nucleotidase SurE [Neomegalonema sp.]|nr:5'/3'-nucleotidase SurE [Neomegalonema sp.]
MRILVTNDDGIAAPGLKVAEAIAAELAGPGGEVWTVAPAFEQSGVSHAISFTSPVKVEQLEARRFACAGTPADCVILAMHAFMKETPPDLVISGVNRGHNIAEDTVYSGTVGGAIEAALQGVKAVALSQYFMRPGSLSQQDERPQDLDMWETARTLGAQAVRKVLDLPWETDLFYNINFPPAALGTPKGLCFARQGRRRHVGFGAEERVSPAGRSYFWVRHRIDNRDAEQGDDCLLCADGWATIVPMKPNYTDYPRLAELQAREN